MSLNNISSNLINIYVSPSFVFRHLKEQPNFLLPLLLIISSSIIIVSWYYSSVDFIWLIEYIATNQAGEHSADEAEQMVSALPQMATIMFGAMTIVSLLIFMIIQYSLLSLYFVMVSLISNHRYRFKHWFSLVSWASMPILLVSIASAVNIALASNGQLGPDQLNALTLNNLFFHVTSNSSFKSILDSVDISLFWSIVLLIFGYREWTNKSIIYSTVIVTMPYLLVYGIWFFMIFF